NHKGSSHPSLLLSPVRLRLGRFLFADEDIAQPEEYGFQRVHPITSLSHQRRLLAPPGTQEAAHLAHLGSFWYTSSLRSHTPRTGAICLPSTGEPKESSRHSMERKVSRVGSQTLMISKSVPVAPRSGAATPDMSCGRRCMQPVRAPLNLREYHASDF